MVPAADHTLPAKIPPGNAPGGSRKLMGPLRHILVTFVWLSQSLRWDLWVGRGISGSTTTHHTTDDGSAWLMAALCSGKNPAPPGAQGQRVPPCSLGPQGQQVIHLDPCRTLLQAAALLCWLSGGMGACQRAVSSELTKELVKHILRASTRIDRARPSRTPGFAPPLPRSRRVPSRSGDRREHVLLRLGS